jgi:aminoglycoside phosphotransferase (APT) family kinase protein
VVSHGDFNIGQLLRVRDGRLALLDLDTLCLAPRAFDLASYGANLLSGRARDLDEAKAVTAGLVHEYGASVEALPWYLAAMTLRRIDRPLRRRKREWFERTDELLRAAEQLAP